MPHLHPSHPQQKKKKKKFDIEAFWKFTTSFIFGKKLLEIIY